MDFLEITCILIKCFVKLSVFSFVFKQQQQQIINLLIFLGFVINSYMEIQKYNEIFFYSPILVSYACRYSEVINCETNELFPTADPPNMRTLCKENKE